MDARPSCAGCRRSLRVRFVLEGVPKCTRCALSDRTLLARSARVAALVGTVLVALNQGDQLWDGSFPFERSWWKLPLTYAVPFLVASYGALANGYQPAPQRLSSERTAR